MTNTVDLVTAVVRSPATIDFTRVPGAGSGTFQETVGPSACFQAGVFVVLADPVLIGGGTIDPLQVREVSSTGTYNIGEPVFVRLEDTDQNVDAALIDYATVDVLHDASGDSVTIQLTETGIDTGVFAGYVPTASGPPDPADCLLQATMDTTVRVSYSDPADPTDGAESSATLDPVSVVFESVTGAVLDGASIAIVEAATGLPATVYGNDGVSIFPSTITSGATEADSAGNSYTFGPGEFRFPLIPAGEYLFLVTPPGGYAAPSVVASADLQQLAGAPYSLGPASFGNAFTQSGPTSVDFDIPVDPLGDVLYMQKSSTTSIAAPGDFVRYELSVENTATSGFASNVRIVDQLPTGVRFMPGSVMRDGLSTEDPLISPDRTTLEFLIGDLAGGEQVTIHYVVEIVAGARNDELVNSATAIADFGLASNKADARIRLTEDLFRSTGTLIGRVVEGHCSSATFAEDAGVSGIRIYLEDGRFAVSDEAGRFHFEGLNPGTHVAQIDPQSVPNYFESIGCDTAPQFAGRTDSQFVRLHRGSLNRADFYMRRKLPAEGEVNIALSNIGLDSAVDVGYVVRLNGDGNVRIKDPAVNLLLPDGVSYLPGTLKVDGVQVSDPRIVGQSVGIEIADQFSTWSSEIRFSGHIAEGTSGELITKAFAKFDSPVELGQRTPIVETSMVREPPVFENASYSLNLQFNTLSAELSTHDALQLEILIEAWQGVDDIHIQAVGHTDGNRIAPENRKLFADNFVLSRMRARAATTYLARILNVKDENIQIDGRGASEPVASNATSEGRQANRRVELVLSGKRVSRPSFLDVTKETSGVVIAQTMGLTPGTEELAAIAASAEEIDDDAGFPTSQIEVPLNELTPGIDMMLPAEDFQPAIPTTKISIKHRPNQTANVTLNGLPVNPLNFDGRETNAASTVAVSRWKGVDLQDGANKIVIDVTNADGSVARTLERTVHYADIAVRGEIIPDMSVLVADGAVRPLLAIRLYDRSGRPARTGTVGTYRVSAPYRSWWEVEEDRKNPIVAVGSREPSYRIGADGIAFIELEPTAQAGEAKLMLNFGNQRQQELRTWLSAEPRDWVLVGFAEGTVGYNTLTDNLQAATDAGFEDGYFDDGRVAFFAKGQIKGEYLLTLAYDTDHERSENLDRFQTVVDPNAYYGLYADRSEQRYDAPSQRKLYLKLERNQFFALFGDFETGLSVTELSRYQRRFNGLKAQYRGRNVGYTMFATDTNQAFVRDELRGDGTSGLYHLSNAPLIANSELIRIEVRDRFDTGQVLSTTTLSRYLDYSLNMLDGALYFKQPVPSRDAAFNPIFIVAEYESQSTATNDLIAGGRVSLRTTNDNVEVGLTHVNEGTQGAEADLSGVDLRWQVRPETLVQAEIATSSFTTGGVDASGSAQSITVEHQGETVDVRGYIKQVDEDFGLGQQNTAEKGIRKVGIDGRAMLATRWYLDGDASWQQNLETDTIRNLARAQLRYENAGFTASSGLTHASDKFTDGTSSTSSLADVTVSQKFGDVSVRASSNFAVAASADNIDFPTGYVLGADYRIFDGVDLFAEYEDSSGSQIDATMTRLGVKASPWNRAQLNSSITNQDTEYGPRLFSNVGLVQGFQLNEHWVMDVGLDQASTIVDPNARRFDPDRELVSGSLNDDFIAAFTGLAYSADSWSANSRVEYRDSDSEKRLGLLSGWYREPSMGHSLSAGLALFSSDISSGGEHSSADFKFGWAWRKAESRWAFLNRIDLIFDTTRALDAREESRRLINNFNANRRISARTQLSMQYAFKYVLTNFDNQEYSGFTDLVGLDFRRGFKNQWDWGAHTSIYHSYESKVIDYGLGLDVGYNVRDNMWVTLGYNIAGFYDSDFTAARYTAMGPYLQISIKADQHMLKSVAGQTTN